MSSWFYHIGRQIGRAAMPILNKGRWVWTELTGNEQERLRAEIEFGSALAVEVRNNLPPASHPADNELCGELCARLAACLKDKRRRFRVEVVQDADPNAMALPGGFIFVSEALLDLCERRPPELALVVGHEMAHVVRGHVWDRMVSQVAGRAAATVLRRIGPLGAWVREQGLALLQSAYAQDCEREADELGLHLTAGAGWSPEQAVVLMDRLDARGRHSAELLGRYFSSHPPPAERARYLRAIARRIPSRSASQ